MNKHEEIARQVVKEIGGVENIASVTNCMTRLRFNLKDVKLANEDNIKMIKGVQGVVYKGGQYQVIIGADVSYVCDEIKKMGNFSDSNTSASDKDTTVINKVLGAITEIFQPVIPAICGAGMIKAVLALLVTFKLVTNASQTYVLLNMFADAAFYFLPLILAFSSAKKFNCNPYVAAVLGGILIHPTFSSLLATGEPISFIGLPIKAVSYGSAVVPPILIVMVQSYIERFAKKISPNAVKIFLVPLITFMVVAPLALIVIGPLGSMVGGVLYYVFDFLNNEARWVIPVLMGGLCPLFVMTGMHYSFVPVQLAQYASLGYGTLLGPGMLVSNISQAGACFGVALRTKNKELRSTAISAGTTALFGITEPALYGVTMKLKRPLFAVMLSGGLAGLWAGLTNMRTYASASAGLTALPVYITDDLSNVVNAAIAIVISFIMSFVFTVIFGLKEDEPTENVESTQLPRTRTASLNEVKNVAAIFAPMTGELKKLEEVDDEVFSKKIMGSGIAVVPSSGEVVAPFDGVINTVFPTKHAIGMTSNDGVEVIIHIGLDTVELEGKYFESHVNDGQKVAAGDKIISFNLGEIIGAGYDITTPIVVTNCNNFLDIIETDRSNINQNEELITVYK